MVAISNLPALVATSCVTFVRRSFSGKVTNLTLMLGYCFSNTCWVNCSIWTICELFTVATVSVVVPEEDDWLLGEHAANPASSRARPVSTATTRAVIFMADSSLGRNKKYDNRTPE